MRDFAGGVGYGRPTDVARSLAQDVVKDSFVAATPSTGHHLRP
jgi:hypothetical protein